MTVNKKITYVFLVSFFTLAACQSAGDLNEKIAAGDPKACAHKLVKKRIYEEYLAELSQLEEAELPKYLGEFWSHSETPTEVYGDLTIDDYNKAKELFKDFEMTNTQATKADTTIGEVICSTDIFSVTYSYVLRQSLDDPNDFLMSRLNNGQKGNNGLEGTSTPARSLFFLAFLKEAKKISIARNPIKRSSEEPPVDNAAPADDADIAQPAPAEDEVSEEDYAPPAG